MDATMWTRNRGRGGGLAAVGALLMLAGCSSVDGLLGSRQSAAPAPATSSSSSFTDRFSNFVLGSPMKTAGEGPAPDEIDCPSVEIRQGASTFSQSGAD